MINERNERAQILIVDDREADFLPLDKILSNRKFDIIRARSSDQALKIATSTDLALIILDLQMPGADAFKTLPVPIIFCSSDKYTKEQELKVYQKGCVDILYKPIDPIILEAKISSFTNIYLANQKQKKQLELEITKQEFELLKEEFETTVKERTKQLVSEQLFLNALLENLNDGIVACDAEGKLTVFNRATRNFHGLPEKPLPPEDWAQFYSLFEADGVTPLKKECIPLYRALNEGKVEDVEMVIAPKASQPLSMLANGQSIVAPDGSKLGAVVIMRNITETKRLEIERKKFQAEDSIRRQREQLLQILSKTAAAVCVYSGPKHIYQFVNDEYIRMAGNRDYLGRSLLDVVSEVEGQQILKTLDLVYQTGKAVTGKEEPIQIKDDSGQLRLGFFNFNFEPLFDEDKAVIGIIVTGVEVTDQVLARNYADQASQAIQNERENFRNLFRQTPEMVCIFEGPEHRFEFINESYVKMIGFDSTGQTIREAQPESVEVHGILDEVYRTGKTADLHEIPITVTGRIRYFNLTYAARKNIHGEINGVMILGMEVTDQVNFREKLMQSEDRERLQAAKLTLITNGIPDIIAYINSQERYEFANPAYKKYLEEPVNIIGKKTIEVLGESYKIFEDQIKNALKGINSRFQGKIKLHDGSYKYLDTQYISDIDSNGKVRGFVVVAHDITEIMQSRELAQNQLKWLEAVLDRAQAGILLIDPKTAEVKLANQAAHKMTGGIRKDISLYDQGFWGTDFKGNKIKSQMYPRILAAGGEKLNGYEFTWHTPKGTWDYLAYSDVLPTMFGLPETAILSLLDVTELTKAQREAKQREQDLQALANSIPQLAWMAEPDGNIFWYNEGWYKYTGKTEAEMQGWGWQSVHDPKILPEVIENWVKSLETGVFFDMTFPLKGADGKFRWFLTRVNPLKDETGKIIRWFGTNTDVQKERESALDLKLKSDALENSLNGFDIVNEDNKFIYVNSAYLKMWGYSSSDEVLGTSPAHHCADPDTPLKIINMLKQTGQCDIEFVARRKDGSTFDVRMLAFLAHDSEGKEIYPTTSIDITEQKRNSAALQMAKEQAEKASIEAEKANELKSTFLANMSHEIRTPLGAMIGFADLLRDPNLSPEEHSNFIDILARNGEQLSIIINDILDLSKVEAGHLTLEFLPMSLDSIAADVLSLLRVKAKEKDLTLEYISDESVPSEAISDPVRVRQVLLNLITNAIKFTHFGSVKYKSYAFKEADGRQMIAFEVTDTGIGIPDDQKKNIFEMFVQADGSMTRRFGGTGLGLTLSKKLARGLGGDIILKKAAVNQGSTFLFTFENRSKTKDVYENHPPIKKNEIHSVGDKPLEGIKILVVDDAPDNQKLIWRFLTIAGAIVKSAENGLEGYKAAISGDHDLVLMDIQMPVMDGYAATQRLRENGYKKPIIALTAHAMNDIRKKAMNVGYTDHVAKPINRSDLIETIVRYTQTQPS